MGRRDPPSAPPSSRREHSPEHRHRTVGCMAGIFHIFSLHHHHSRKRLTSAKKKEKTVIVISPSKTSSQPEKPPPTNPAPFQPWPVRYDPEKTQQPRHRSSEDPRSPTIPVEIRHRSTESIHSSRQPPTLLPRLMGLEEAAPHSASPAGTPRSTAESAADKRRRLLGALEKCDEDLKTLKRIIDAVREVEVDTKKVVSAVESPPAAAARTGSAKIKARAAGFEMDGGDMKAELGNGEQPSPVSVLDAISSPRYRSKRTDSAGKPNKNEIAGVGLKIVKPSRMGVVFSGKFKGDQKAIKDITKSSNVDRENPNSAGRRQTTAAAVDEGMPRATGPAPTIFCKRSSEVSCRWAQRWRKLMIRGASRAMAESVGEMWEDGVWEERSEVGRVAAAVAGGVLWDLVEEIVLEMPDICWCSRRSRVSLSMRRCRKRLFYY